MSLQKTIVWIDKTEGRDKFCKVIQYLCRLLKFMTQNQNKEMSQKFQGLFVGMRDARKLFRLFKSINEYQKIQELLKKGSMDPVDLMMSIGTRLGFLFYWLFDNLAILCAIKFIKKDQKGYAKKGAIFWFIALLFSLVQNLRNLMLLNARSKFLRSRSNKGDEKLNKEIVQVHNGKATALLNIIKSLGDMITAGQGSEIVPLITGKNFHDGWIGAGGLISALITSYQLY